MHNPHAQTIWHQQITPDKPDIAALPMITLSPLSALEIAQPRSGSARLRTTTGHNRTKRITTESGHCVLRIALKIGSIGHRTGKLRLK